MKKLIMILCLYFFVSLYPQTTNMPDYSITTGKIPNVLRENDLKRQFEIMELEDFVNWLKRQSKDITEGAVINEERLTNLLMNNYNMRKRVVTQELRRYHRPILKYIPNPHQRNWVAEWLVIDRIETVDTSEAPEEAENPIDDTQTEGSGETEN